MIDHYTLAEEEVNDKLFDLFGNSLTQEMFTSAFTAAYSVGSNTTSFHSPTAKATYIYHEMVGQLGILASSKGWTCEIIRNFPVYGNPIQNCLLLLRTGGKACGKTLHAKPNQILSKGFGSTSAKFVTGENTVIPFDDIPNIYMLLFRFDVPSNTMYWEISEPNEIVNGKIISWKARYLLPPINCSVSNFNAAPKQPVNSSFDFDIEAL